ncbi:MAG: magnesium transporter [Candidatus Ranarchaeia archaeon]
MMTPPVTFPPRPFKITLREAIGSLVFSLGGLVTGLFLMIGTGVYQLVPWGLALFPGVLSGRGLIGGIFAARISTGLHLGVYNSSMRKNTPSFYRLFSVMAFLAIITGLLVGTIAALIESTRYPFFSASGVSISLLNVFFQILLASTATLVASFLVISPVTLWIASRSFERGWDPDVTTYPIKAIISDISVSGLFIIILLAVHSSLGIVLLFMITAVVIISLVSKMLPWRDDSQFRKEIRELILTVVAVAFFVNFTGRVLMGIAHRIQNTPVIYLLYPAILNLVGSVGAIVGSTSTTKFSTGELTTNIRSFKNHIRQIVATLIGAVLIVLVFLAVGGLISGSAAYFIFVWGNPILLSVVLGASVISGVTLILAFELFKRGADPDNFVIPVSSVLADNVTTIFLFLLI